jgi:hypothetical protein
MLLEDESVRCTTVPGHKLPVGSDFAKTLVNDIGDSALVIGLLTPAALSSGWVLFELGATWGAQKNLKPLVADSVDLKALPGPLVNQHAAKLSSKSDIAQFIEEAALLIGAKKRTAAKADRAISDLVDAHAQHMNATTVRSAKKTVETSSKEPQFSGIPYSELVKVLGNEEIVVPAKHSGGEEDKEATLFQLFVGNSMILSDGLRSDWDRDTPAGWMYEEVGLRLLTYGLMQFEKLPAAQAKWFKRLIVSPEGHKFLLQYKRWASVTK